LIETNYSADYSQGDTDTFSNNEVCNVFCWAIGNGLRLFSAGLENSSTQRKKTNFLALGKRIPDSNDRKYISVHNIIIESTVMKNMRNFLLSFSGHVLAYLLVNFF
jgi:hypothetical protein